MFNAGRYQFECNSLRLLLNSDDSLGKMIVFSLLHNDSLKACATSMLPKTQFIVSTCKRVLKLFGHCWSTEDRVDPQCYKTNVHLLLSSKTVAVDHLLSKRKVERKSKFEYKGKEEVITYYKLQLVWLNDQTANSQLY